MIDKLDYGEQKHKISQLTCDEFGKELTGRVRMRTSSVLIYKFRGISTEIIKNLVLAGIGNLIILDEEIVKEDDLGANFFLREDDLGKLVCYFLLLFDGMKEVY